MKDNLKQKSRCLRCQNARWHTRNKSDQYKECIRTQRDVSLYILRHITPDDCPLGSKEEGDG